MKYIIDPLLGLIVALFGLVIHPVVAAMFGYAAWAHSLYWAIGCAPFLVGFVAVLCAKWTGPDETGYERGDVPGWAFAWSTPDERLPGDVRGEPSVKWAYKYLGRIVCSMYWLLERNRGMGLSYLVSRKTSDQRYLDGNAWGYQEIPSGAWRRVWRLGSFASIGIGNQTTMVRGQMWIRPWVSVKRQHNGNP